MIALMASAAETIVLGSPEKLNTASPYVIVQLSDVTAIIVSRSTTEKELAPIKRSGLIIHKAP